MRFTIFFFSYLTIFSNPRKLGNVPHFEPQVIIDLFKKVFNVLLYCHVNINGPRRTEILRFLKKLNLYTQGIPDLINTILTYTPNVSVPILGYAFAAIQYEFGKWSSYRSVILNTSPDAKFFQDVKLLSNYWQQFQWKISKFNILEQNIVIFPFYTIWDGKSNRIKVYLPNPMFNYSSNIPALYFYAFTMPIYVSGDTFYLKKGFDLWTTLAYSHSFIFGLFKDLLTEFIRDSFDTSRITHETPTPKSLKLKDLKTDPSKKKTVEPDDSNSDVLPDPADAADSNIAPTK